MNTLLLVNALLVSLVLFVLFLYLTYLNTQLFYQGVTERLPLDKLKAKAFYVTVCASIITDIYLFLVPLHAHIIFKNVSILAIIALSYWLEYRK